MAAGTRADDGGHRSSGPDSLAPPPSPYPSQIEPSPTDSNGTETTEIEEDVQEVKSPKPPDAATNGDVQSPDIEITSPQSSKSVRARRLAYAAVAH